MDTIERLKNLFKKFPGIGPRQAERFVYFLLYSNKAFKEELARAILNLEKGSKKCPSCQRFFVSNSDEILCKVCADPKRDKKQLMLVEKETDVDKIENSGAGYTGLYFVLQGTVSPLQDSAKHEKYIRKIKEKIKANDSQELILALSTTFEGEYSAKFIKEELTLDADFENLKITILGRGLSSGSELEYVDPETIKYALKNRLNF